MGCSECTEECGKDLAFGISGLKREEALSKFPLIYLQFVTYSMCTSGTHDSLFPVLKTIKNTPFILPE